MSLDRNALLAALNRQVVAVEVPDLGGEVRLREMTVKERSDLQRRIIGQDGKFTMTQQEWDAAIFAATVCDEDGAPLCTEEEVLAMSAVKVAAVAREAEKLNGFGATATADAEKNSKPTRKSTSATT